MDEYIGCQKEEWRPEWVKLEIRRRLGKETDFRKGDGRFCKVKDIVT